MDIKRFALTAIASAIFAFHVDMATADDEVSCSPTISGTASASERCQFDVSTGSSLTVADGGSIGGIDMGSATTPPGGYDADQITIDAGGQINSTGIGINIYDSNLSNGIVNNGTISAANTGISIGGGSTVGSITNNGSITSTASGTGIRVNNNSSITGNITNNGTITGSGFDPGIAIIGSTVYGSIVNNRTVNSGPDGAAIYVGRISTLRDSVINNGEINSEHGTGISVRDESTIDGQISNSGQITAGNDGILVRSGSQVIGGISNSGYISSDGLDDGSGGVGIALGDGTVHDIFNTGKIHANHIGIALDTNSLVSGSISNSGTIQGGDIGIKIQSSTVSGGITNSGTIQGGTDAIYVDPGSIVTGGINIVGQHARVIGNVDAVGTNFNINPDAVFTSEGTFDVDNFNIDSSAVFNMANAITVYGSLTNAGTLSVNSMQTLTGNYVQASGGVFQTEIGNGTYGQLSATGAVDLLQSGHINVELTSNSTLHAGEVFSDIIHGENTLTGPTAGFDVTDTSPLWKFTANTNNAGNGVNLTAAIDPNAYNICQGTYCQGAANAILGQLAAGNSAFDGYNLLTTDAAFQTAASQATPTLTNENIEAIQMITSSMMDVLPMWNMLHGESEDAMLYQPNRVWVKPYGGSLTQDDNETVPGFNATAYGVVTGIDTQPSANWLVGGAVAAGGDTMQGSATLNTQSLSSATFQGMLYGTRELSHHLYLAGQGSVGYDDNDSTRSIPLYSDTASGSYGSWFTNLRTQFGWNYLPTDNLVLTPDIDATYLFINQGSYTESGSPMDLSVDSNNNSSLILGVYGNGVYHLATLNNNAQRLNLTGYAGVARNLLNSQPETNARFIAGGPSFSTDGTQFNGFVFRGGVGLELAGSTEPLSLSLNYDVQAGNNAYSNFGSCTLSYKF